MSNHRSTFYDIHPHSPCSRESGFSLDAPSDEDDLNRVIKTPDRQSVPKQRLKLTSCDRRAFSERRVFSERRAFSERRPHSLSFGNASPWEKIDLPRPRRLVGNPPTGINASMHTRTAGTLHTTVAFSEYSTSEPIHRPSQHPIISIPLKLISRLTLACVLSYCVVVSLQTELSIFSQNSKPKSLEQIPFRNQALAYSVAHGREMEFPLKIQRDSKHMEFTPPDVAPESKQSKNIRHSPRLVHAHGAKSNPVLNQKLRNVEQFFPTDLTPVTNEEEGSLFLSFRYVVLGSGVAIAFVMVLGRSLKWRFRVGVSDLRATYQGF